MRWIDDNYTIRKTPWYHKTDQEAATVRATNAESLPTAVQGRVCQVERSAMQVSSENEHKEGDSVSAPKQASFWVTYIDDMLKMENGKKQKEINH